MIIIIMMHVAVIIIHGAVMEIIIMCNMMVEI